MKPMFVDVRGPDEATIRRMWSRIEARLDAERPRSRRPRRGLRVALVAGPMVAAAAALVVLMVWPTPGVERVADRTTVAASDARIEVIASDAQQVTVALHAGRARFAVAKDRRWVIEAGHARVVVIDTAFEIARYGEEVTIVVERGELWVEDRALAGGERRLVAGDTLTVGGAATAPPVDDAPEPARDVPLEPARPPALRRHMGEEARARETEAETETKRERMSVEVMLADADRLRRNGQLAEAARVLARVAEVPDDPLAGIAWFTRARVLIDLGRESEAATDIARAIDAGLPPALEQRARRRLEELAP